MDKNPFRTFLLLLLFPVGALLSASSAVPAAATRVTPSPTGTAVSGAAAAAAPVSGIAGSAVAAPGSSRTSPGAGIEATGSSSAEPCLTGLTVTNSSPYTVDLSVNGDGYSNGTTIPPGSSRRLRIPNLACIEILAVGRFAAAAASSYGYAAALKEKNRTPAYTPAASGSQSRWGADASGVAGRVADESRRAYEERKAREAEASSGSASSQPAEPTEEAPREEPPASQPASGSSGSAGPTTTSPPRPEVGYGPSGSAQPPASQSAAGAAGGPAVATGPHYPAGEGFRKRITLCGRDVSGGVTVAAGVVVSVSTGRCKEQRAESRGGDEEDLDEALLAEIQEAKDEEDKKFDEELEKLEKDLEGEKEHIDKERERRKKHPARERNARERQRLDDERKDLDEERDKIDEEQDKLDQADEDDDALDKNLREKEQKIRRSGDPNCQSPPCREIKEQKRKLYQRRQQRLKQRSKLAKKIQDFNRRARDWEKRNADLENRLDRGEGLTKKEWKARMKRKKAEEMRRKWDEMYRRFWKLDEKVRHKKPMTPKEQEEYRNIRRTLKKNGGVHGVEKKVRALEIDARKAAKELVKEDGGTFEDWDGFFQRTSLSATGKPGGFDGRSWSRMTNKDLKKQSDRLGKSLEKVKNARARIGKGGEQPPDLHDGLDRLDKTRARIDGIKKKFEALKKESAKLGRDAYDLKKRLDNPSRRTPGARQRLERARRLHRPKEEIDRLEREVRRLEREVRDSERKKRALQRKRAALEDDYRRAVDDYNFDRFDAAADQAHNAVGEYNRSFGSAINPDGSVNRSELARRARAFEKAAGELQRQQARLQNLERVSAGLKKGIRAAGVVESPSVAGSGSAVAAGAGGAVAGGITGAAIGAGVAKEWGKAEANERIAAVRRIREEQQRAQVRRDAAVEELKKQGFEVELDDKEKLKITKAPRWAGLYAAGLKRQRAKAAARPAAKEKPAGAAVGVVAGVSGAGSGGGIAAASGAVAGAAEGGGAASGTVSPNGRGRDPVPAAPIAPRRTGILPAGGVEANPAGERGTAGSGLGGGDITVAEEGKERPQETEQERIERIRREMQKRQQEAEELARAYREGGFEKWHETRNRLRKREIEELSSEENLVPAKKKRLEELLRLQAREELRQRDEKIRRKRQAEFWGKWAEVALPRWSRTSPEERRMVEGAREKERESLKIETIERRKRLLERNRQQLKELLGAAASKKRDAREGEAKSGVPPEIPATPSTEELVEKRIAELDREARNLEVKRALLRQRVGGEHPKEIDRKHLEALAPQAEELYGQLAAYRAVQKRLKEERMRRATAKAEEIREEESQARKGPAAGGIYDYGLIQRASEIARKWLAQEGRKGRAEEPGRAGGEGTAETDEAGRGRTGPDPELGASVARAPAGEASDDPRRVAITPEKLVRRVTRVTLEEKLGGSEATRVILPDLLGRWARKFGAAGILEIFDRTLDALPKEKRTALGFLEAFLERLADVSGEKKTAARLAHLLLLKQIASDAELAAKFGVGEKTAGALEQRLNSRARNLAREYSGKAREADARGDVTGELEALSGLLALDGMGLGTEEPGPILRRIEALQKRLEKRLAGRETVEKPEELLRGLEGVAVTLGRWASAASREKANEKRVAALERLLENARLQKSIASRAEAEKPGMQSRFLEAVSREARLLLALGRVAEAYEVLRGVEGAGEAQRRRLAKDRAMILKLARRLYPRFDDAARETLGDPEAIRIERRKALEEWLKLERDTGVGSALAVELARSYAQDELREQARQVLDRARKRFGGNVILEGERLALDLAELPENERAGGIENLIGSVPPALRAGALAIALRRLSEDASPETLERFAKEVRELPAIPEADRSRLRLQAELARLDALRARAGQEGNDRKLRDAIEAIRAGSRGLPKEIADAVEKALRGAEAELDEAAAAERAVREGKPPKEGWIGLARGALRSGRIELAAGALEKELERIEEYDDWKEAERHYTEILRLLRLVRARRDAAVGSEENRKRLQAFLDSVGEKLDADLEEVLGQHFKAAGRLAVNLYEKKRQWEADEVRKSTYERYRRSYYDALDRMRRFARLRAAALLERLADDAARRKRLAELLEERDAYVREVLDGINSSFAGQGEAVEEGERRKSLERALGELNGARAWRDGVRDLMLARAGKGKIERWIRTDRVSKTPLEWELFDLDIRLNGSSLYEKKTYGVRGRWRGASGWRKFGELAGSDKDRQRDLRIYEDEIAYLERRRFELVMENPHLSKEEKRELYAGILEQEARRWKKAGESVSPLLLPELTGLGEAEKALAKEQFASVEKMRLGWLKEDLEAARNADDPQRAFEALVRLRDAALAGEIETYVDYLELPWYKRGPVRGARIGLWGGETAKELERVTADVARLDAVLLRAAYRPVAELSSADRSFLEERGFIENGRYVLPKEIKIRPTRVASELADEGTLGTIDKYLNAVTAAELVATVVLPGGVSSRLAAGAFERAALRELIEKEGLDFTLRNAARYLATREGAKWLAAWGAERAVEAALFTGLSRSARTALNPELLLDDRQWTLEAIGGEYLHNLAVLSALQITGAGANAAKEALGKALGSRLESAAARELFRAATGAAEIGGEAAVLTGLQGLVEKNGISREDFVGNLVTVALLKAFPSGAEPEGFRPELSRTVRAMERYNRWLDKEYLPTRRLIERFGGNWNAIRDAYRKGKISEQEMRGVFELRKRIIDDLAAEIVEELGGKVSAFGSDNLTSDYDLSFYGPKAELAVILFNARFKARWSRASEIGGKESATRLDVNFYTNPVFDAFQGGRDDAFHQDGFAHMAARKYLTAEQWEAYKRNVLESTKEAMRNRVREQLAEIENRVAEANARISAMEKRLAEEVREAGSEPDAEDIGWAARNRLYEESLREIIRLKELYEQASGGDREALAQKLRAAQSTALFFAAEAYQTEAAIKHVVFTIQAAGRKVTVESLLAKDPPELSIPLTKAQGRQSFFEQLANTYKEINHGGDSTKLAGKGAKYFLRALDAARIAGVDLRPLSEIVKRTVEIESVRSKTAELKDVLERYYGPDGGKAYLEDLDKAYQDLTRRIVEVSS
ncbi:MAG: hypothetical protein D6679_10455 [Candidatus Hydrogenedentota bacterium]|nr:MAG: hypothetical protein D6679_10455 [Candidatus Hydrogenedentota bacterium]